MKKGLVGLIGGVILVGSLIGNSGCAYSPSSGYFMGEEDEIQKKTIKKETFVIPPSIFILPIHAGVYSFEKIMRDEQEIGIKITKKHWADFFGLVKRNAQEIWYPKGAENIGIANDYLFNDSIYLSYDLNGERRMDEYHIGFGGDKCEKKVEHLVKDGHLIDIK